MRRSLPTRLVIATHNQGKLHEFAELFRPYVSDVVSSGALGLPSPEETGTTCVENALLKARTASQLLADPSSLVLADDSGLFIDALQGRPGVYSADWIKPDAKAAMQRVQNELGAAADRSAYFLCILALCWADGHTEIVEGRTNGTIARAPRGVDGHGYDPIFVPEGRTRTFAEMSAEEKNALSHRGRATKALIEKFFSHLPQHGA